MRRVFLVPGVLWDQKVRKVSLGPGVAKEQLAYLERWVSGTIAMICQEFVFSILCFAYTGLLTVDIVGTHGEREASDMTQRSLVDLNLGHLCRHKKFDIYFCFVSFYQLRIHFHLCTLLKCCLHVFVQVLKVPLVILSLDNQGRLPLDYQDHVVNQDLWDSLVMWVLLGLQDVKAWQFNIFSVYVYVQYMCTLSGTFFFIILCLFACICVCVPGAKGLVGSVGLPGTQGPAGRNGPVGDPGDVGQLGFTGPQGE